MTYTLFKILDGNSFSQRFRKNITIEYNFSRPFQRYIICYNYQKRFIDIPCFSDSLRVFLSFFKGKVSVDVFENIINEFYVLRPFVSCIILFCSSNIRWFFDLYILWGMKRFPLKWFNIAFSPVIFFKNTFLENYDRYEAQIFRVY